MTATQIVWACAALLLMAAEVAAPGFFLLWLGFAAAGVFAVLLLAPGLAGVWQTLLFAMFSIVSVGVYLFFFRKSRVPSDQPLLNRRAVQLIGQVYPLESAIVNGRGRLKIGDAFWVAEGPDMPAGTRVRIAAVHGMSLKVQPEA
jgi:membrane protein implicated in regulation of membrane protease activity